MALSPISLVRLLLSLIFSLLLPLRRHFSLISLRGLLLSLSLHLCHLSPAALDLALAPSTSIHLWIPSRRSRENPKPALLIVHGFGGNALWQFERTLPALARSFDLYVPDLLFFGDSITASPDRSVRFQARCLIDAMELLGVPRYSVAGISYGGFVAYSVAEMAPERVERVVILTAGVCTGVEERRELVEREGRDVCDVLLPTRPEDLMELMRRSMYRPPRWMPEFLLRDFIEVI